jgi:WD40 repeat protein
MLVIFSLVPISQGLWHAARNRAPHDGGTPLATLKSGDFVSSVRFSPDSRSLATASLSGVVLVLDIGSRESRTLITPRPDQLQPALRFQDDGRLLILPQNANFWELWSGEGLDAVRAVDFRNCRILNGSIGDRSLAGVRRDSFTILVRDRRTGVETSRLAGHQAPLSALAFAPDETILASSDVNGWLKLWDLSTGTERASTRVHASPVCHLAFSPDGAMLATVNSSESTIRLWDGRTGAARGAISIPRCYFRALAFHPNGRLLAVADTLGFVLLLDLATGRERARVRASNVGVLALEFSPDGRSLATAGLDRMAKVWDLDQLLNPRPTHSEARASDGKPTTFDVVD